MTQAKTSPIEHFEVALMRPLPKGNWDFYFSALALFHVYSRAESDLNATISVFVHERIVPRGQPKDSAIIKALLGGSRIGASRDTLKRLLRVVKASEEMHSEVNRILSQLGEISFFRDRLAHNGAAPGSLPNEHEFSGWFSISNSLTSREFEQLETISFTPQILMDMAYDLFRIPSMLAFALSPQGAGHILQEAEGAEDLPITRGARKHLAQIREPWRYKPSQLKRTGPKHSRNPR